MTRCIDCKHCEIEVDEHRNAKARCKLQIPPKKGKILTWAQTVFNSMEDAILGIVGEYGDDRVRVSMSKLKKVPPSCPLLKERLT